MENLVVLLIDSFAVAVLIAAFALVIFSASFANNPGPTTYYSHFCALFLAACLAFETTQLLLLISRLNCDSKTPLQRWSSFVYWAVVTASGLGCLIAYSFTPKDDAIAIEVLVFAVGLCALYLHLRRPKWAKVASHATQALDDADNEPVIASHSVPSNRAYTTLISRTRHRFGPSPRQGQPESRLKRVIGVVGMHFNRFLRVIHAIFSILFVVGAVSLATTYRFTNPGTSLSLTLPSFPSISINIYCTSPSSSSPTIYLASSPAHGIVDYLGLQHYLALPPHNLRSCSFDPPSFGWSSRFPASVDNVTAFYNDVFAAVVTQLEGSNNGGNNNSNSSGVVVLAGWGAGAGTVVEASRRPDFAGGGDGPRQLKARAVVLLGPSAPDAEFWSLQRRNGWTTEETGRAKRQEMTARAGLARAVLALGVPWGLMPLFVPSTEYFDPSLAARFRAQGLKEDLWAAQYYALLQLANEPLVDLDSVVPVLPGVEVFAVANYNDSGVDEASNALSRQLTLEVALAISGGNLTKPLVWCADPKCESGRFPVDRAEWTADVIAELLGV